MFFIKRYILFLILLFVIITANSILAYSPEISNFANQNIVQGEIFMQEGEITTFNFPKKYKLNIYNYLINNYSTFKFNINDNSLELMPVISYDTTKTITIPIEINNKKEFYHFNVKINCKKKLTKYISIEKQEK